MSIITKNIVTAAVAVVIASSSAFAAPSPIVISGYIANPAGTDSPHEYVQFKATQAIDFASTNYSVVFANNGTATSGGWIAGGTVTYGFTLSSGSVAAGDVFYVGGSGKLINGAGSTDISSATFIRTIDTASVAGDSFGTAASGGVLGNGGGNADGIAVFSGAASSLTASTVPVDAIFFGTGVGSAKPVTGGYTVPTSDLYNNTQGTFGNGTNTAIFGDPASGAYTRLSGTYDTVSETWTTARTGSFVTLTANSTLSDITSAISVTAVPEPTAIALVGLGSLMALRRRRA